jgi:hypothetical protein
VSRKRGGNSRSVPSYGTRVGPAQWSADVTTVPLKGTFIVQDILMWKSAVSSTSIRK